MKKYFLILFLVMFFVSGCGVTNNNSQLLCYYYAEDGVNIVLVNSQNKKVVSAETFSSMIFDDDDTGILEANTKKELWEADCTLQLDKNEVDECEVSENEKDNSINKYEKTSYKNTQITIDELEKSFKKDNMICKQVN